MFFLKVRILRGKTKSIIFLKKLIFKKWTFVKNLHVFPHTFWEKSVSFPELNEQTFYVKILFWQPQKTLTCDSSLFLFSSNFSPPKELFSVTSDVTTDTGGENWKLGHRTKVAPFRVKTHDKIDVVGPKEFKHDSLDQRVIWAYGLPICTSKFLHSFHWAFNNSPTIFLVIMRLPPSLHKILPFSHRQFFNTNVYFCAF